MRFPHVLVGALRIHGADLARLQRLLDPLCAAALFRWLIVEPAASTLLLPGWLWALLLTAVILPTGGLYGSFRQRSISVLARRLTSRWLLVIAALLTLSYITKTTAAFSRVDTSLWAWLTWAVLLFNHVGLRQLLRWHRSQGGNRRTILFWGTTEAALALQQQLRAAPWMGLHLLVWFSPIPLKPDAQPPDLPRCSGGIAELSRWLKANQVDRIVFSHLPGSDCSIDQLLRLFGDTCIPVFYAPHWITPGMQLKLDPIGSILCLELWGADHTPLDRQIKRAFDLLLAGTGTLLISPVLLLIAIAIALTSPGPVLFAQERYGLDGRRFRVYKFRTMHVMEAGDSCGLRQATRHDPRVTPLGRLLRRWSLDELPQLFNVLRGEMSLVGPRPHAVDHNEQYRRLIPGYMQRHAFKPGITGLAQVEGWRGETATVDAMARRVDADLRYQANWSLKLDIKILIKTLLRLRSPNAY